MHKKAIISVSFMLLLIGGCAKYTGPFMSERGVTVMVKAPGARQVAIVGNFNGWDKERDRLSGPDSGGWWTITLPLGFGRYEYLFLLNGKEWLPDPSVPLRADDGFGAKNSMLYIGRGAGIEPAAIPPAQELERTVAGAAVAPLLSLVSEAKRKGLPERPVLNKILEGLAKGATSGQIETTTRQVLGRLETAAAIIGQAVSAGVKEEAPSDRYRAIEAGAVLIGSGISQEEIASLGRDAGGQAIPLAWFARSLEAMANLTAGGMPPDLAVRTARTLILSRYSEKGIARVEGELFYWHGHYYNWTDSFYQFHSGCLPGRECSAASFMD